MAANIHLLVSADYEVFLGQNFLGNEEVLFKPTEQLMEVCEKLGVKLCLFADICSVWAHRDAGDEAFARRFEDQLQEAVRRGHDVQLHLHPNWLVSEKGARGWTLKEEKIHLHDFGLTGSEAKAPEIINRGFNHLTDLLQSVDPDYRCLAYRAGGLVLQPQEKALFEELLKAGITIESSIARGYKLVTDTVSIDYTQDYERANWFMDGQSGLADSGGSGLFEIPIATFKMAPLDRLKFLAGRVKAINQQRGSGISKSERPSRWGRYRDLVLSNLRYLGKSPNFLLSADTKGFNVDMLVKGFKDYLSSFSEESDIYVSMINHPKLMFDPQLRLLDRFISSLQDDFGHRISFPSYQQVAQDMERRMTSVRPGN